MYKGFKPHEHDMKCHTRDPRNNDKQNEKYNADTTSNDEATIKKLVQGKDAMVQTVKTTI